MTRPSLWTIAAGASAIGMSERTARALVSRHGLGVQVEGGSLVLTAADLERLRSLRRPAGNPQFGPGYHERRRESTAD